MLGLHKARRQHLASRSAYKGMKGQHIQVDGASLPCAGLLLGAPALGLRDTDTAVNEHTSLQNLCFKGV
jgi:hypothetical protein